jgi:hypothetical protein
LAGDMASVCDGCEIPGETAGADKTPAVESF